LVAGSLVGDRPNRSPEVTMPGPKRRLSLLPLLVIAGLILATVGVAAVNTNTLGAGDKFDRLIAKIERFISGPPPNLPDETVEVTPRPSVTSTPSPTVLPPGVTPPPTPPPPVRTAMDVTIIDKPKAVFAHEIRKDWCAPAGVQMTLAALGLADTSDDFQRTLAGRVNEWESYSDSHNGEWGPTAMAKALAAYGAPGYKVRAYDSRADALFDAAVALETTHSPVILLAWRGAHTWVMDGYKADADPALFPDAKISGTYILDPWFPWNSSIWGQSDPPGTFQDASEMQRNFLVWKRPEGTYPARDGKFIIVVPTLPAPNL
jgi:hypothetical protein